MSLDVGWTPPRAPRAHLAEILLRREGSALVVSAKPLSKGQRRIGLACVALDRDAVEGELTERWADAIDRVDLADEETAWWVTGQAIEVPSRRVVQFKASAELKARLSAR